MGTAFDAGVYAEGYAMSRGAGQHSSRASSRIALQGAHQPMDAYCACIWMPHPSACQDTGHMIDDPGLLDL